MRERGLCIRNLENGDERVIPLDFRVYFPNWSSSGKTIIVTGYDNQDRLAICRVSTVNSEIERILRPSSEQAFGKAILSSDGKSLFYVRGNMIDRMQIMVRDLESGTDRELYRDASRLPLQIALSPDGRSLAVANRGPDKFLKVLAISGGEPRALFTWKEGVFPNEPVWTPNVRQILFLRNRCHELWSIAAAGGEPQMLGRMDFQMDYLSMHPNGRTIVFGGHSWPDVSGIWVMENFLPKNNPEKKQHEP